MRDPQVMWCPALGRSMRDYWANLRGVATRLEFTVAIMPIKLGFAPWPSVNQELLPATRSAHAMGQSAIVPLRSSAR